MQAKLTTLKKRIESAHKICVQNLNSAFKAAISAGEYLAEAKELVEHGKFTAFVEDCGLPPRTARWYMTAAKAKERVEKVFNDCPFDAVGDVIRAAKELDNLEDDGSLDELKAKVEEKKAADKAPAPTAAEDILAAPTQGAITGPGEDEEDDDDETVGKGAAAAKRALQRPSKAVEGNKDEAEVRMYQDAVRAWPQDKQVAFFTGLRELALKLLALKPKAKAAKPAAATVWTAMQAKADAKRGGKKSAAMH